LAGAVWCTGTLALWVAGATADLMKDSQVVVFWLSQGAPLVAAVLGLVVWKEMREWDLRVKAMSVLMLLLFASGLALLSMAPVHGVKGG
jgi:glucose uptake protein